MAQNSTPSPHADLPIEDQLEAVQQRLDGLQAELAHSQRLATLGTMAASIAHEINNILTPVLSYAAYAKSNPDDQALQQKAIDKSLKGAELAATIARALLDFSSPRPNQPAAANINQALDAALTCLAREPEKDNVQLVRKIPDDLAVAMQPQLLQQVLLNLIINAVAVMRQRGGSLTIEAGWGEAGITIHVADTGPGIPPDMTRRLFQPFVTRTGDAAHSEPDQTANGMSGSRDASDRRPADRQGGNGLGLAICKHLIEQAGGSIDVQSTPGEGSTFTITLPPAQSTHRQAG